VPPHAPLRGWYETPEYRSPFVRALFDRVAGEYDDVNALFSLGSGRWYRRAALREAGLRPGMQVLDVATGTGLVAREIQRLLGGSGLLVGLDQSAGMLSEAQVLVGMRCVQGRAEALPVPSESFDFLSLGYALRHLPDLRLAFEEFFRALRPAGTVLVLEISRPTTQAGFALAQTYFRWLIPLLCRLRGYKTASDLLGYYWDTIEACVSPDVILATLQETGFADVKCDTSMGVFRAYSARKPRVAS
jgi:demethylmenaquinone methyltransferase / 2-methoxy-6-polyprenyl-1,4-benzoquinol methylase